MLGTGQEVSCLPGSALSPNNPVTKILLLYKKPSLLPLQWHTPPARPYFLDHLSVCKYLFEGVFLPHHSFCANFLQCKQAEQFLFFFL